MWLRQSVSAGNEITQRYHRHCNIKNWVLQLYLSPVFKSLLLNPLINYFVQSCEGNQAGVEGYKEFGVSFQLKSTVCSVSDNL